MTEKKKRSRPPGGHRVTDAAGRPLIGMAWPESGETPWSYMFPHRPAPKLPRGFDTTGDEDWRSVNHEVARPVALVYPEQRVTEEEAKAKFLASNPTGYWRGLWVRGKRVKSTCVRPACVSFFGSTTLYRAEHVDAPRCPGRPAMTLLDAIESLTTEWWVNAEGTLERLATEYEVRLPDLPPRDGWRLISAEAAESLVRYSKHVVGAHGPSDTEREEQQARRVEKERKLQANIDNAAAMVARYERRTKLVATLLKKWQRKLARLEKRKTGGT